MAKTRGGLTKWFKEDWRDVKTGKKCGRSGPKDKRKSYPACRPKSQAGSAMAKKMAKKKTGPARISWKPKKDGRKKA
jgi:hypothetical protein